MSKAENDAPRSDLKVDIITSKMDGGRSTTSNYRVVSWVATLTRTFSAPPASVRMISRRPLRVTWSITLIICTRGGMMALCSLWLGVCFRLSKCWRSYSNYHRRLSMRSGRKKMIAGDEMCAKRVVNRQRSTFLKTDYFYRAVLLNLIEIFTRLCMLNLQ